MTDDNREERILTELKRLIVDELHLNLTPAEIQTDASFFEDGLGIDSIAIVELISIAEEHFDVRFADEDLVPDSFSTVRTFAQLIAGKPQPPVAP